MKKLTKTDDLIVSLINLKQPTRVKIFVKSEPKFNKKGRETKQLLEDKFRELKTKNIYKYSEIEGIVAFDYQKIKATFNATYNIQPTPETEKKASWHTSISKNGVLKEHISKKEKYIFLLTDDKQKESKYLTENNDSINKKVLAEFLPKKSYSDKPTLPVRMYKLNNIIKFECNDFIYIKEDNFYENN